MTSFVSLSLKIDKLIFIWPLDSWQGCWPQHGCLEPPNLSDLNDTDEEVDTELWSLLNPWSGKGEGDWGGVTCNSHCPWPQWQPHCGTQPHSWYTVLQPHLGTSHHAAAVEKLAGHRDGSWLLKLNSVNAGGNGSRMSRPSWVDASFSDGLGNQPLAFTQAYRIGTKLGLFANPINDSQ